MDNMTKCESCDEWYDKSEVDQIGRKVICVICQDKN